MRSWGQAGWHKLHNSASRAVRIFPIYGDFCGLKGSQRVKVRPAIGGEKAHPTPQSSVLSPGENLNIRTLRIIFRTKSEFEDSPQLVPSCLKVFPLCLLLASINNIALTIISYITIINVNTVITAINVIVIIFAINIIIIPRCS